MIVQRRMDEIDAKADDVAGAKIRCQPSSSQAVLQRIRIDTEPANLISVGILVPIIGQPDRLVAILENDEGPIVPCYIANRKPGLPKIPGSPADVNHVRMNATPFTWTYKARPLEIEAPNLSTKEFLVKRNQFSIQDDVFVCHPSSDTLGKRKQVNLINERILLLDTLDGRIIDTVDLADDRILQHYFLPGR